MGRVIELGTGIVVRLRDGSTYGLRPGPRGKGISILPSGAPERARGASGEGDGGGRRGRPPRPSTLALRSLLARDAQRKTLHPAGHYVAWLRKEEPEISRASAQQIVTRERRRAAQEHGLELVRGRGRRAKRAAGRGAKRARRKASGAGRRGRQPAPATVQLRERLATDQKSGKLGDAGDYVRWLVDQADIGIKQARPIVYRELRSFR